MCLGQRLVGFETSPFYQDFQFGSQIGFAYKINAFMLFLMQPLYNQWTCQYISNIFKNTKVLESKLQMKPYQKSLKWFHFKNKYETNGFGTPFFLYGQTSSGLISKRWNETISNIHKVASFQRNITKPMVWEHTFIYMQNSSGFINKVWTQTISKIYKKVSSQRSITKPIVLEHTFVYMHQSKSVMSKIRNGTTSKIHKVVSCQSSITKPMVFEHPVLYMQTSWGFTSKVWNETIPKRHKVISSEKNITKPMRSATSFWIQANILGLSEQILKWNNEKVM